MSAGEGYDRPEHAIHSFSSGVFVVRHDFRALAPPPRAPHLAPLTNLRGLGGRVVGYNTVTVAGNNETAKNCVVASRANGMSTLADLGSKKIGAMLGTSARYFISKLPGTVTHYHVVSSNMHLRHLLACASCWARPTRC